MATSKSKNDSRMRRTFSWIVGTDRLSNRFTKQPSTGNDGRPKSLSSFLPSIPGDYSVENAYPDPSCPNSTSTIVAPRPPPFFYSRPLREAADGKEGSYSDHISDLSLGSFKSEEAEQWKIPKPHSTSKSSYRNRLGFLKPLLQLGKTRLSTPSTDPGKEDVSFSATPDTSLCVEYPRQASDLPVLCDHPFGSPQWTIRSQSFAEIDILPPPPRHRHEPIKRNNRPFSCNVERGGRSLPGIDPAKWAEISISASDLVRQYGRGNLVFGAAPKCPSDDSLEGEQEGLGDLSFFEMELECGPLQSSPCAGNKILQSQSYEIGMSSMASSMVGSMTSLSKWPLPPHYEKFEPLHAIP